MTQQWYAKRGDLEFGPWSAQELKAAAASGVLRPDDLVRQIEKDKWVRSGDVKGLEPNSSQRTSPELPTSSRPGPPPLPASQPPPLPAGVCEAAPRIQGVSKYLSTKVIGITAVTGTIIVAAGLAGLVNGSKANREDKELTAAGSAGVVGSDKGGRRPIEDVTFGEITALLYQTPDEMTALLGSPEFKYRGPSRSDSWFSLGGWKRKNGNYVMIIWLERIHPQTGRLELANVSTNPNWQDMTREQVEAHRGLIR
jgi:hypothetical protein